MPERMRVLEDYDDSVGGKTCECERNVMESVGEYEREGGI